MPRGLLKDILLVLPLVLQLIGLTFAVLADSYISRHHRRILLVVVGLILTLIFRDFLEDRVTVEGTRILARTLLAIYGYAVRPAILVLFFSIVKPEKKYGWAWVAVGVNAVIYATALFSDICFRISPGNHFLRGPLGFSCHILCGALLLNLAQLSVSKHGDLRRMEAWIPIFNVIAIIAAVAMDSAMSYYDFPTTCLTMVVVTSSVFYYIWLHLQFVRAHEQALQAEQRIQIMMTQIQPHFLFNTLNTIRALCAKDPPLAIRAIEQFSAYLRQNLESLSRSELIPLARELEHARIYAEIEQLRFPGIRVDYDIADEDCLLPALTIQPLVENAIRHGVRARDDGRVVVASRREGNVHVISIRDDGMGFDAQAAAAQDGSHIGIANVRKRLEQMCGGTLAIESRPGVGTTVTLRIPERQPQPARGREKT